MPSTSFEERLKRLNPPARTERPAPAPVRPAIHRRDTLARFDHGMALVALGGQKPDRHDFLRLLARMGFPVAPMYYWPMSRLFAVFLMVPLVMLFLLLAITEWRVETLGHTHISRPEWLFLQIGHGGFLALCLVLAPLAAWRHKRVARKAGLPPWSEV